jgi:PAS domain S-box-containing protein
LFVDERYLSGDALFGFDDELNVVSWNEAAEELTGIRAGDAIGRPCWDVLCGVDNRGGLVCHRGCSGARLARQGWPVSAQEMLVKATGGRRRVMVSTIAVRQDGATPLYLHVMRDGLELEDDAQPRDERTPELTPRQLEVLEALAAGEQAKAIARRLEIAETTVRNHIRMILVELGCHSQLEAVAEARRRRLTLTWARTAGPRRRAPDTGRSSALTFLRSGADHDAATARRTVLVAKGDQACRRRRSSLRDAWHPTSCVNGTDGIVLAYGISGSAPKTSVAGTVLTDENCEPDRYGVSHCLNRVALTGGGTLTVRHDHNMGNDPCLSPGEKVVVRSL